MRDITKPGRAAEFKFYFPDDGETPEDAEGVREWAKWRMYDADEVAREAVEHDWNHRDGWERGEDEFPIVVIEPDGTEHRFIGRSEPSIDHFVREADDDD